MLRLVSMFLVVSLHVMGKGGVLDATTGFKHHVIWLLEVIAFCAVDCFAIISGFVSYSEKEKPYRYSKFFGFWLQVFTYSFGITLIAFLLKLESVGVQELIKSFIPVTTYRYWYVSAYAGLFFVLPWLNKLLRACTAKEATRLVTVLLIVFSLYVTFANYLLDTFQLQNGYSFVWLVILYLVGAWLKKCDIPKRISNSSLLMGSVGCILYSWAFHEFLPNEISLTFREFISNDISGIFVNYISFTIVFVAISLVCIFSKLRIGPAFAKGIAFFAPAAFGVYLIHEQSVIRAHFIDSAFVWIADFSAWLIPLLVLSCAFGILMICLFIEKGRQSLFKLLKIDRFTAFVEQKLDSLINKAFEKITSKV